MNSGVSYLLLVSALLAATQNDQSAILRTVAGRVIGDSNIPLPDVLN
jgi:hypothetical protein